MIRRHQSQQQQQVVENPEPVQEVTQSQLPVEKDANGAIIYSVDKIPPVLINGEWRSPDGVALINPATGNYYQPGDILSDGKTVYTGIFDSSIGW